MEVGWRACEEACQFIGWRAKERFCLSVAGGHVKHGCRKDTFDWSQFDDEHKYLDQVEVRWEESTPVEIRPDGTVQTLWREGQTPESSALTHGTILRMEGLRDLWGKGQFETLHMGLSRLLSPFFEGLLARFSRYFGRLGTPDLDMTVLLQRLQAVHGERTA